MAGSKDLLVRIIADASSLQKEMAKAEGATESLGSKLGGLAATAAKAGAAFAAVGLAVGIDKSIKAAENMKVAQDSLTASLKAHHIAVSANSDAVTKFAESQAKYGKSADEVTQALARGVAFTGSLTKAQQGYQAALLISKATGKDFNAVQLAVSKAQEGQTAGLSKYIGKVDAGTTSTQLLADVTAKFGGQAAANTTVTQQLHANLTNLEEVVGEKLLPAFVKLVEGMNVAVTWAQKNWPAFSAAIGDAIAYVAPAFEMLKGWVMDVVGYVQAHWPQISQAVSTVMNDVKAVISTVVTVVTAVWAEFGGAITRIVKTDFETAWTVIRDALNVIRDVINAFTDLIHGRWANLWNDIKGIVSNTLGAVVALIRGSIDNVLTAAVAIGGAILHGIVSGVSGLGTALWHAIRDGINAAIAGVNDFINLLDSVKVPRVSVLGHGVGGGSLFDIPNIPQLAEGGIVTRATLALIGERGPEAVVPLRGSVYPGAGASGATINVTVNGWVGNDQDLANKFHRELVKIDRNNAGLGFT